MRGVEVFTGKQNGLFAGLGETTTSAVVLDCMRTKHFCTWVKLMAYLPWFSD